MQENGKRRDRKRIKVKEANQLIVWLTPATHRFLELKILTFLGWKNEVATNADMLMTCGYGQIAN